MREQRIFEYFPELTEIQRQQISDLYVLYSDWNSKINVISRKDMEHFYERHVLHSLAIAKVIKFLPAANVLDVGTGGGFPGLPLAILFPETNFHLVDAIGKKIKVVQEVAAALGIKNISTSHQRAEEVKANFDFVVSRAVTRIEEFYPWVARKFKSTSKHDMDNGILYLKGLDLEEEFNALKKPYQVFPLSDYFTEEFFSSKAVLYVPVR
jgi:16S rRNA (guanine527-N7)-methyltransferase